MERSCDHTIYVVMSHKGLGMNHEMELDAQDDLNPGGKGSEPACIRLETMTAFPQEHKKGPEKGRLAVLYRGLIGTAGRYSSFCNTALLRSAQLNKSGCSSCEVDSSKDDM